MCQTRKGWCRLRERTYWYTDRIKNTGIVWAGRVNKQVHIRYNVVGISKFTFNKLHIWDNAPWGLYMRHPTYKAACAHAGIRPVRIKWGGAPHPKV